MIRRPGGGEIVAEDIEAFATEHGFGTDGIVVAFQPRKCNPRKPHMGSCLRVRLDNDAMVKILPDQVDKVRARVSPLGSLSRDESHLGHARLRMTKSPEIYGRV